MTLILAVAAPASPAPSPDQPARIPGAPSGATAPAHARRVFQTAGGNLLLLDLEKIGGLPKVVYRLSSDQGQTWSSPVVIDDANVLGGLDAVQVQTGGNRLFLTYTRGATGSQSLLLVELNLGTRTSFTPPRTVPTNGAGTVSNPSIVHRGAGLLGESLALGFWRKDPVLGGTDFVASFSEDSGSTWLPPITCGTASAGDTLAEQGSRTFCIQATGTALTWSEWSGATWGQAQPLIEISGVSAAPSTAQSSDGRLHLVAATGGGEVLHTALPAGSSSWAPPMPIGAGVAPVIATDDQSLYVYAADPQSFAESLIRRYSSEDGVFWSATAALSGAPFGYVLDYDASWAFGELEGDALFSLTDGAGTFGNRIGTGSLAHVLNAPEKKVAFGFTPGAGGSVDEIRLWLGASSSPKYRVGIRADSSGAPSGAWLNEVKVGGVVISGAFADVSLADASFPTGVSVTIPQTSLAAGQHYWVVVEAAPVLSPLDKQPGPSNWIALQSVGADPGAEGSMAVLDGSAPAWAPSTGQVPRMVLRSAAATVLRQELAPISPVPATEYSVPGELFVADRDMQPTDARVFLAKVGNPAGGVTLRLLDAAGSEIWSAGATSPVAGWTQVPVSGVVLHAGTAYRIAVDAPTRDVANYWSLGASSGETSSWQGDGSALTRSFDRPGFNDRTDEASETRDSPVDFVAFNSGASDALYLGGAAPFDFAVLARPSSDPLLAVGTAWTYWNGSAWAALPTTRNTIGEGRAGEAALTPPSDWAPTSVDGRPAYWAKIASTAGQATPVSVDRLTKIRNLFAPSVPAGVQGYVPLVYSAGGAAPGVEFAGDPTAPYFPKASKSLSADFCIRASAGDGTAGDKTYWVVGDTSNPNPPVCASSASPVSVDVSMTPDEKRFIYGTLDAVAKTADGYWQVANSICIGPEPNASGIITSGNNWGEKIEPARFLFTAGVAGAHTCQLKARVRNLASKSGTWVKATPANGYTYIKVEEGDKVGGEQWTDGDVLEPLDLPGDPLYTTGPGVLIWPGHSYDALVHIWSGAPTAAAMRIMGDVGLTDCHEYCDLDGDGVAEPSENGTYGEPAVVTTELKVAEQSALDPALHCDKFSYKQSNVTITAREHHTKLLHDVNEAFRTQYCTGLVDIRVTITVPSSSVNPVMFSFGMSPGIAMNVLG